MTTYYDILQIEQSASRDQVKKAFRSRAKECHPDYHPERSDWAHGKMQELLRAYEVLIDGDRRAIYDRSLLRLGDEWPSYRETLTRRPGDIRSCCQLIFLDLLEGRGEDALILLAKLQENNPVFDMRMHMSYDEYLDCGFLLAEEFERQDDPERAFRLYHEISRLDRQYHYFRHFRVEVLQRLRNLLLHFIRDGKDIAIALEAFATISGEGLPRAERSFLYKKLADRFWKRGEMGAARLCFFTALQLKPKLGGVKRISHRLGAKIRLVGA